MSPRLELEPGVTQAVSLARGSYQVTVQTADGTPVESPLAMVEDRGFLWSFGCPPIPEHALASTGRTSRPGDDPPPGTRAIRFANTTPDCGDPMPVVFLVNDAPVATVPAGGVVAGHVPSGEFLLVVASVSENRRLLVRRVARVESGQTLPYGCTDPDFVSRRDGVPVVFENATDSCPSPGPLTLWVDGWPRIGLPPGRAATLGVPRGLHDFDVRPGLLPTRLLQGSRNVQVPFRIRYGCSKQD